jgi:hypothetical protein
MRRRHSVGADRKPGARSAASCAGLTRPAAIRPIVALGVPALLIAVSLGLLVAGQDHATRPSVPASGALRRAAAPMALVGRGAIERHRPAMSVAPSRLPTASPRQVALRFVVGWLSCNYHRASSIPPDALPAFATAFARQTGVALPTPAELQAHLKVISVGVARTCPVASVARVTYTDGAERFWLHLNLVRTRRDWLVFDVAEAPPHIPLPVALGHGAHGC